MHTPWGGRQPIPNTPFRRVIPTDATDNRMVMLAVDMPVGENVASHAHALGSGNHRGIRDGRSNARSAYICRCSICSARLGALVDAGVPWREDARAGNLGDVWHDLMFRP